MAGHSLRKNEQNMYMVYNLLIWPIRAHKIDFGHVLFFSRKEVGLDSYFKRIALTGGPGGGKTTLISELLLDSFWSDQIIALPEAISLMSGIGISPQERLFQKVMVSFQIALEDSLSNAFINSPITTLVCHRGSLDPLAYWLARGWLYEDFFTFTNTSLEAHYRRYNAVIHLVTAADGAVEQYSCWPESHRKEKIEDAVRLDGLLYEVWCNHPAYYRIDNQGRDWEDKSLVARTILSGLLREDKAEV
jgi:hypothetical protein